MSIKRNPCEWCGGSGGLFITLCEYCEGRGYFEVQVDDVPEGIEFEIEICPDPDLDEIDRGWVTASTRSGACSSSGTTYCTTAADYADQVIHVSYVYGGA